MCPDFFVDFGAIYIVYLFVCLLSTFLPYFLLLLHFVPYLFQVVCFLTHLLFDLLSASSRIGPFCFQARCHRRRPNLLFGIISGSVVHST